VFGIGHTNKFQRNIKPINIAGSYLLVKIALGDLSERFSVTEQVFFEMTFLRKSTIAL
jgi:predicted transporter